MAFVFTYCFTLLHSNLTRPNDKLSSNSNLTAVSICDRKHVVLHPSHVKPAWLFDVTVAVFGGRGVRPLQIKRPHLLKAAHARLLREEPDYSWCCLQLVMSKNVHGESVCLVCKSQMSLSACPPPPAPISLRLSHH